MKGVYAKGAAAFSEQFPVADVGAGAGAGAGAGRTNSFLRELSGEAEAARCPCPAAQRDAVLLQFRDALRGLHAQAPTPGMELNPERLEDIGSTVDLPHHPTSEAELRGLLRALGAILHAIGECGGASPPSSGSSDATGENGNGNGGSGSGSGSERQGGGCSAPATASAPLLPLPPALVTIARSEDDGYTPRAQAVKIEAAVLAILEEQYGALDVVRCEPWRGGNDD